MSPEELREGVMTDQHTSLSVGRSGEGEGTSSGEDRATAAEPKVSALRDGIPSAFEPISMTELADRMAGRKRSESEIFADGCKKVIWQIEKLEDALIRLKQAAAFAMHKGRERHDDDACWKRARKACDALFEGIEL